ncbi:hypothetical protein [Bradyrhizobium sp. USDA 4486]
MAATRKLINEILLLGDPSLTLGNVALRLLQVAKVHGAISK